MLIKAKEKKHNNPFGKLNIVNNTMLERLKGIHPKYASHMWQRNGLVEAISKERFGGVEVLSLPVCRKCEKPGAWNTDSKGSYCSNCKAYYAESGDCPVCMTELTNGCYCFSCGEYTPASQTKTLWRYIAEDSVEGGIPQQVMGEITAIMPVLNSVLEEMYKDIDEMEPNNYVPTQEEREAMNETNINTV
jgi:hypothetical protein